MTTNKHGLPRAIPSEIKREVRRACRFGCVICGTMPYDYEHFAPEYVDAKEHDPDGIALLCPRHHREKTVGRLSSKIVQSARKNPYCSSKRVVWETLIEPENPTVVLGNNRFTGLGAGLVVNNSPIFQVTGSAESGEAFLTGSFVAKGHELISFHQNETSIWNDAYDVTLEGRKLTICAGVGHPVIRLEFDGRRNEVRVLRLSMQLSNGFAIHCDEKRGLRMGRPGQEMQFSGNSASGPSAASVSVNLPEAGQLEDWKKLR